MVETFNSPSINAYYNTLRVHKKSIACFLYFVESRSFHSSNLKIFRLGGVKVQDEPTWWRFPLWAQHSVPELGKALLLWHSSHTDAAVLFNGVWNVPCMQTAVAPVQGRVSCRALGLGKGEPVAGSVCPALPSPPAGLFAWHQLPWGLTTWI